MKEITVKEVLKKTDGEIIDVRETDEYATGHLPQAKNIPLAGIMMNPTQFFETDKKYYIVCESGGRSMYACEVLEANGYDVTNVIGGTSAYRQMK